MRKPVAFVAYVICCTGHELQAWWTIASAPPAIGTSRICE